MHRHIVAVLGAPIALTLAAGWAEAKVIDQTEAGFSVAHTARVAATPEDVWKMLRMPQKWWSKDHSWSGNAENFWLDSQAGGCFCEKLPGEGDQFGSVQHARIVFAEPGALLRLSGAFGPLQGEAVTGTLTIMIKSTDSGSAIRFEYVVGGYMRFKAAEMAPVVDGVIGEQLVGLTRALGGALPVPGVGALPVPGVGALPKTSELDAAAAALADGAKAEEAASPQP